MFSRTSFGVAGIAAAERFSSPVAAISMFVIVQMVVYASMQLPAGMLLDRLGPRRSIALGTAVMALGQVGLALATWFWAGLGARVLIGAGDAVVFMSAIRLVVSWFPARRVPVLTQITSVFGQLGQWASAVPLVRILADVGWTPAFLTVAAACAVGFGLNLLFVRDTPQGAAHARARGPGQIGVGEVVAMPAAQLGFFIHMATASTPLIFTFMWGFPYLTKGQGLSNDQAGTLFTVMVAAGIIIGPVMGELTQRFSAHRTRIALVVVGVTVGVWMTILVWPGQAPMALLGLLMVIMAADYPASNIPFDINRSYLPPNRLGTGSGLVVVGGFSAALVTIPLIGAVLNLMGGDDPGPEAFRWAMAVQLPMWAFAVVMVLRSRRRLRAWEAAGEDEN